MAIKLADYRIKEVIPSSTYGKDYVDWGLVSVGAEVAWQKTKGKGIRVAVLDTGVDIDHPDLVDNIVEAVDFTDSKHGVEDMQGHGTHVAGIIAAGENNFGMVGVAPEAKLYIAKVLGDNGGGSFKSIMQGIQWAIDNEVHIISMSLGSDSRPPERMRKLIREAVAKGIIFIAATGNENRDVICYPAKYDEVIAVSAVNRQHQRADFANYGVKNMVVAPGVDIVSTYRDGTYARLSGTSMATPIVTGAVALILARYKELFFGLKPSPEKVHQILKRMVKDLGEEGKDEIYGAGMINLAMLP